MAKREIELLSKNAYAKYLGVNEKAIRKAVKEGKIKKGWDPVNQKIIKHLADKEYGFLHQVPTAKAGINKEKQAAKIEAQTSPNKTLKSGKNSDEKVMKSGLNSEKPKRPNKTSKKSEEDSFDDEEDSDREWEDTPYDQLLLKVAIDAKMPYSEIVRRQAVIDAALAKKKLEEMEDILIRKESVEKVLFAYGRELKKALMGIPARIIDEVLNAPNKVEAMNIFTEELTSVLDQYCDFEGIRLSNK